MWPYVAVFFAALLVDSIPVFAPPAWTLIVLLVVKFKLDIWIAVGIGAVASTIGRYLLSRFMPKVAGRLFNSRENGNIGFLGHKLGGRFWPAFSFVFVYSLTPMSTTALFTAAGVARVDPLPILPAFLIGKFLSDAFMVFSAKNAIRNFRDILKGQRSPKSMIFAGLGLLLITAVLFIDWRELLQRKRVKFRFAIWR
jgi:membrane protein YqaA with SNARE-associated domain